MVIASAERTTTFGSESKTLTADGVGVRFDCFFFVIGVLCAG